MEALFILYVKDQQASRRFYAAVLLQEPSLDVPGMTAFRLLDGCVLGLMPEQGIKRLLGERLPDPATANGVPRAELYLLVDDPQACHRRALENGARELSPLAPRGWGDVAAYSLDPRAPPPLPSGPARPPSRSSRSHPKSREWVEILRPDICPSSECGPDFRKKGGWIMNHSSITTVSMHWCYSGVICRGQPSYPSAARVPAPYPASPFPCRGTGVTHGVPLRIWSSQDPLRRPLRRAVPDCARRGLLAVLNTGDEGPQLLARRMPELLERIDTLRRPSSRPASPLGAVVRSRKAFERILAELPVPAGEQPSLRIEELSFEALALPRTDGSFDVAFTAFVMGHGAGASSRICRLGYRVEADGRVAPLANILFLNGPSLGPQPGIVGNAAAQEERKEFICKREAFLDLVFAEPLDWIPAGFNKGWRVERKGATASEGGRAPSAGSGPYP